MASGFKFAKASSLASTGNWTALSTTPMVGTVTGLKVWLQAGQNAVMRLDAEAVQANHTAAAIASEMVFATGVPNTTSWTEVGAVDPSRVWIRSGGAALTDHVYWVANWV
jgi:hypothetical protein